MNMIMTKESHSARDTEAIGCEIIQSLRPKLVLLKSDLGGGKTTMVRGMLDAMAGDVDDVSSPSFTLHNIYNTYCSDARLHHFDLYRLEKPGIMIDDFIECMSEPESLTVVEWPESANEYISGLDHLLIQIEKSPKAENDRIIKVFQA